MFWLAKASKEEAQGFVELKATEQVAVVPVDSDQVCPGT